MRSLSNLLIFRRDCTCHVSASAVETHLIVDQKVSKHLNIEHEMQLQQC